MGMNQIPSASNNSGPVNNQKSTPQKTHTIGAVTGPGIYVPSNQNEDRYFLKSSIGFDKDLIGENFDNTITIA